MSELTAKQEDFIEKSSIYLVRKMFQANLGSSLIINHRPVPPSTGRPSTFKQHHRMQMPSIHRESVRLAVQTPTHTPLIIFGKEFKTGLTRPNQSPTTINQLSRLQTPSKPREYVKPTVQTPTHTPLAVIGNHLTRPNQTTRARVERPPHWEVNKSPVRYLPLLARPAAVKADNPLPQTVTRRMPPVERPARETLVKQSPVRPIQKNISRKKKEPCKDKPQKPVRILKVADFPPVSDKQNHPRKMEADQKQKQVGQLY